MSVVLHFPLILQHMNIKPTAIGQAAQNALDDSGLQVQSILSGTYQIQGSFFIMAAAATVSFGNEPLASWADSSHVKWRFFAPSSGGLYTVRVQSTSYVASPNAITQLTAPIPAVASKLPATPAWVSNLSIAVTTASVLSGTGNIGTTVAPFPQYASAQQAPLSAPIGYNWLDTTSGPTTLQNTINLWQPGVDNIYDIVIPRQGSPPNHATATSLPSSTGLLLYTSQSMNASAMNVTWSIDGFPGDYYNITGATESGCFQAWGLNSSQW